MTLRSVKAEITRLLLFVVAKLALVWEAEMVRSGTKVWEMKAEVEERDG